MRTRNFLFLLPFLLTFSLFGQSVQWENDYRMALAKSRIEKKPLLVFFTGSDWSALSMKMRNEVLNSPDFQSLIADQFVFAEIDFPQHTLQTVGEIAQNEVLKKRFHVEEYPCLLLLNNHEREIIRFGYVPESGKLLAHDLTRIVEQDKELCQGLRQLKSNPQDLRRLYQVAQDLSRADAIEQVLAAGIEA